MNLSYLSFRIVGDNIDLEINARIQTKENTNKSLHWTQQYGVVNRVNDPSLDKTRPRKLLKNIQLGEILPGNTVQENLVKRWAVLVSRVVCRYLDKFKYLQDAVITHIPHKYSEEMTKKSESVSENIGFAYSN